MRIIKVKLKPDISELQAIKAYKKSKGNIGAIEAKSKVQLLLMTGEGYEENLADLKEVFDFELEKTEQDLFYEKQREEEKLFEDKLFEAMRWMAGLSEKEQEFINIIAQSKQVGPACG